MENTSYDVFKWIQLQIKKVDKKLQLNISSVKKAIPLSFTPRFFIFLAEYFFSAIIYTICLSILPCTGLIKIFAVLLLILLLIIPVIRDFFRPLLPIFLWLILFYTCRFIPSSMRPHIWVTILPNLENILYGAGLSNLLSSYTYSFLDILAWIPYGLVHFGAPFVTAAIVYLFSPPGTLPIFAKSFGYLNLIGVIIQLTFPCSPPWYKNLYGSQPANYSMEGSAGGLARIDGLFGVKVYTSTFPVSPLVFGAFPSLHAGHATFHALFLSHIFPKTTPYLVIYVLWLWWCTMYLTHHYFVDLVGGSCLAVIIFYIAYYNYLPHLKPGNLFRWDYHHTLYDLPETDSSEIPFSTLMFSQYKSSQDNKINAIPHNDYVWHCDSSSTSYTNKLMNKRDSVSSIWDEETDDYVNTPNSVYDLESYGDINTIVK